MTKTMIEFRGSTAGRAIRARVTAGLADVMATLPAKPTSTRVAFTDENGPKGGDAIRCALEVRLPRRPVVHVEGQASTPRLAFEFGLEKLERRLRRMRKTERDSKRRPRKYYAARRAVASQVTGGPSHGEAHPGPARRSGSRPTEWSKRSALWRGTRERPFGCFTWLPSRKSLFDEHGRVLVYADQETARLEAEGLDYLHAASIGLDGVALECAVRYGDPVEQILDEAEAWNADLIAMTTRGRSCIGRALLGSVAEEVFRKAPMAVTLYRAERERRAHDDP